MPVHPKSAAWKVAGLLDEDQRALAKAYADAWSPSKVVALFEELELQYELRSLTYRSSKWTTPAAWGKVMAVVCPAYNEFRATRVATWLGGFKGIEVQAARENSPALYVKGPEDVLQEMLKAVKSVKANEAVIESNGTLRLWWD